MRDPKCPPRESVAQRVGVDILWLLNKYSVTCVPNY